MKLTFFKGVVLGVVTCFVMLAGASALAGTGIGDVFNLGQTNSVDATSTLVGSSGGPQLQLTNQGAGASIRGDAATGRGVFGLHNNATGQSPGVEGTTDSSDNNAAGVVGRVLPTTAGSASAGVRGLNNDTNANGYGVSGSHAGSGAGVYGATTAGTGVLGVHLGGTGTKPGVEGSTNSTANSAVGILGRVTPYNYGNLSSGVRGMGGTYGVWGSGLYGVYGSGEGIGVGAFSDQGTGVNAFSTTGNALVATSNGGAGKAAITAYAPYGALAADFRAKTSFRGDLLIEGSGGDIAGSLTSCPAGGIAGVAQVAARSDFSSSYVAVNNSFKCSDGGSIHTVVALRQGTGNYCVKFPRLGSLAAVVGNVWGDNDDFLAITEDRAGCGVVTGETARAYRVRVRDANGGYDDTPFTVVAVTW
jgi:hypothetical protein